MLHKLWLIGLLSTVLCISLQAAEPALLPPLAFSSPPPCPQRAGVRASRSPLIQYGEISASITAQTTREGGSCLESAALWLTRKDVSQQFELGDTSPASFAIVDVAPDSSSILLAAIAADNHYSKVALLSLPDGSLKWNSLPDLAALKNCDTLIAPQGFLDPRHILIIATPRAGVSVRPNCPSASASFAFDPVTRTLSTASSSGVRRFARVVSGLVQSCKSDPDIVAACYTARARLALSENGSGMTIWPLSSRHLMTVEEGMIPASLSDQVGPDMRVYATMLICPLAVAPPRWRPRVCIEEAKDFKPDPLPSKAAHAAPPHF